LNFIYSGIFLLTCSINIFSQDINKYLFEFNEDYYYWNSFEKDINASWRFIYPPPNENTFAFLDISAGVAYGVIPEFYYLGVAGDIALGFDWFTLFSDDKKEDNQADNNKKSSDEKDYQIGVSIGGRIYNLLQIKNFKIWSFIGCDFLFLILPMPYIGGELSYKILGIEYAYYLPVIEDNPARHRISIKFHLPKLN